MLQSALLDRLQPTLCASLKIEAACQGPFLELLASLWEQQCRSDDTQKALTSIQMRHNFSAGYVSSAHSTCYDLVQGIQLITNQSRRSSDEST